MKSHLVIPIIALLLGTSFGIEGSLPLGVEPVCTAEESFLLLPENTSESGESYSAKRSVKIVEAHMNLAPFTSIQSDVVATINYYPSDRHRIEAQGPEHVISAVNARVDNGVLRITTKNRIRLRRGERLVLTIYGQELSAIRNDGVGNFKCSDVLKTDNMKIVNSGVGNITLENLQCDDLVVKNEGVGNITLKGETATATYTSDGVGSIYAYELLSQDTTVKLNGVGSVQCHASERCDYTSNGVGNILYKGRPEVQKIHKNGVGSISPR